MSGAFAIFTFLDDYFVFFVTIGFFGIILVTRRFRVTIRFDYAYDSVPNFACDKPLIKLPSFFCAMNRWVKLIFIIIIIIGFITTFFFLLYRHCCLYFHSYWPIVHFHSYWPLGKFTRSVFRATHAKNIF